MRALRIFLVANDGFSAGHVARTIAIARALRRRSRVREIETRVLIATTSEAHSLLDAFDDYAVVRLPSVNAARAAGFSDAERRRLVGGAIEASFDAFAPDLLVVDTFPTGPHGELTNIVASRRAKSALVRRAVANASDPLLSTGLDAYDLRIAVADPHPASAPTPANGARVLAELWVPPITLGEPSDGRAKTREEARHALGLPLTDRVILVASGGGGDADAVRRAEAIARVLVAIDSEIVVALANGPLAPSSARGLHDRIRAIAAAPLQPWLAAFDGAFCPAGYNTAHELAKARIPSALFAQPRSFDDQAARAARFEACGLATVLREEGANPDAIRSALDWLFKHAPLTTTLESGGADRAADALLDLVTQSSPRATSSDATSAMKSRGGR